jgi:hypothetical protein
VHALAVLLAIAGVLSHPAPQHSPLLASSRIGAITGDCSSGRQVTFTFRADELTPGETVTARGGGRRVRRQNVHAGRPLRITVPLVRQRPRPHGFTALSPVVTWRVFQSHEPDETRALAKLRVEPGEDGCDPVLTRLRLRSRSHAG